MGTLLEKSISSGSIDEKKAYVGQEFVEHCNLQATEQRFSTQRDSEMLGKRVKRQAIRNNGETLENRHPGSEQHTSDEAPRAKDIFACQRTVYQW